MATGDVVGMTVCIWCTRVVAGMHPVPISSGVIMAPFVRESCEGCHGHGHATGDDMRWDNPAAADLSLRGAAQPIPREPPTAAS